jgi:hypothetical protein
MRKNHKNTPNALENTVETQCIILMYKKKSLSPSRISDSLSLSFSLSHQTAKHNNAINLASNQNHIKLKANSDYSTHISKPQTKPTKEETQKSPVDCKNQPQK